jgi:hypothetical protein
MSSAEHELHRLMALSLDDTNEARTELARLKRLVLSIHECLDPVSLERALTTTELLIKSLVANEITRRTMSQTGDA